MSQACFGLRVSGLRAWSRTHGVTGPLQAPGRHWDTKWPLVQKQRADRSCGAHWAREVKKGDHVDTGNEHHDENPVDYVPIDFQCCFIVLVFAFRCLVFVDLRRDIRRPIVAWESNSASDAVCRTLIPQSTELRLDHLEYLGGNPWNARSSNRRLWVVALEA